MGRIWNLITLEFYRNWKQPREWLTVFLFLMSVAVVLFMGFNRMRGETWAVMYWVVMLFLSVGATVGDQTDHGKNERFIFNLMSHPVHLYISKIIYNSIFLFALSLILFTVFGVFFEWKMSFNGLTLAILFLGAISLSSIFCFVSPLVVAANQGSVLASLLGFPLVIPVLLLLIRLFLVQMGFIDENENQWQDILSLLGIDAVLIGLGVILFPLIWRS